MVKKMRYLHGRYSKFCVWAILSASLWCVVWTQEDYLRNAEPLEGGAGSRGESGFFGSISNLFFRVNSLNQQVLDESSWMAIDGYAKGKAVLCTGVSQEKVIAALSKLGEGFAKYSSSVEKVPVRLRSGLLNNTQRIDIFHKFALWFQPTEPYASSFEAYTELINLLSRLQHANSKFALQTCNLSDQSAGMQCRTTVSNLWDSWHVPSIQRDEFLLPLVKKFYVISQRSILTGLAALGNSEDTELLKLYIRKIIPTLKKVIFHLWEVCGLFTARRMFYERNLVNAALGDWLMFDDGLLMATQRFRIKGKFTSAQTPYGETAPIRLDELQVNLNVDTFSM